MTENLIGIGIDIEETDKIRRNLKNKRFLEKIFSKREMDYISKKSLSEAHMTARFCVKEAIIKAAYPEKLFYNQIEILKDVKKPVVKIKNKEKHKISISLSHTNKYAVAVALVLR